MIRIGRVVPKVPNGYAKVRRQSVCENGKWVYAVFERPWYLAGMWLRVR